MKGWKRYLLIAVLAVVAVPFAVYFAFPGVLLDLATAAARSSAGLERREVQVGDHTIVYLEGGKGTAVVLVHGFGAHKDTWNKFAEHLTPDYRVIVPDLPGFGESSKLSSAKYGISAQAGRLHEFFDRLGLTRLHLAGNSMGGAISGVYAAAHPERILSLGLFDTGGVKPPKEPEYFELLAKGENPLVVDSVEDFEGMIEFLFVKPPPMPGFAKRAAAAGAMSGSSFNRKIFKEIVAENDGFVLDPLLAQIRTRSLILWGDTDRVLDPSSVTVLERGLANDQTVIMKDCGHVPQMERPREAAEHYLAFLEKVR